MIIFDLDGTLADCEHRRHFVNAESFLRNNPLNGKSSLQDVLKWIDQVSNWKPNWKSFYETCDQDQPIKPVLDAFIDLTQGEPFNHDVQIWSARCESVREKSLKWLMDLTGYCEDYECWDGRLKMRPVGDSTPDDVLKERWLDAVLEQGKTIDFVFDDRPKVIRMWRRRGVFVFNCCQHDEDKL